MLEWWEKNFATVDLGDRRLDERAMSIGRALSQGFGKALSEIFSTGKVPDGETKYAQRLMK